MRLVFERPLARYVCCSSFVASDTSVDCGHRCTDLRSIAGNQRTDYSSSESIRGYTCLVYLPVVGMCVHKYTAPNIARHTGVSRSYAEFWFLVARASKRLVSHRWKSCYPNTNAVNHHPRVYVLRRKAFSNICNGTRGMLSLFQSFKLDRLSSIFDLSSFWQSICHCVVALSELIREFSNFLFGSIYRWKLVHTFFSNKNAL